MKQARVSAFSMLNLPGNTRRIQTVITQFYRKYKKKSIKSTKTGEFFSQFLDTNRRAGYIENTRFYRVKRRVYN